MATYVALLRAVNVGGTGALPMATLRRACADLGFVEPQTLGAAGNAVFDADLAEAEVKRRLERRLAELAGQPIAVLVRTGAEVAAVGAGNPFPQAPGNFVYSLFLPQAPAPADVAAARGLQDERLQPGAREIYIAYPNGMGRSKLILPASRVGTARNLNTVAKLAAMAAAR